MRKDIIDFAVWYSGMTAPQVEKAYKRYLKEELNSDMQQCIDAEEYANRSKWTNENRNGEGMR